MKCRLIIMCYYITIAAPTKCATDVSALIDRGLQIHPTRNPAVMASLPDGLTAWILMEATCSCGMYVSPRAPDAPTETERLRKKYAKSGWSDAKIDRAVTQSAARHSASQPNWSGLRPDVVALLQRIGTRAGQVAVVVHWYEGGVETEGLSLKRLQSCSLDELALRASALSEDEALIAVCRPGSPPNRIS